MNQRQKVQRSHLRTVRPAALPSYLCCRHVGRLHGLCLAYGAVAPPGREGRVTNAPQREQTTPGGGESSGGFPRSAPWNSSVRERTEPGGPQTVGVCGCSHRCPWEPDQRHLRCLGPLPRKSVGLNRAPPAGQGLWMQACPPLTSQWALGQERACGGGC